MLRWLEKSPLVGFHTNVGLANGVSLRANSIRARVESTEAHKSYNLKSGQAMIAVVPCIVIE